MVAQSRASGRRPALGGAVLCLALWCIALLSWAGAVGAADADRLAAPVYPGAVPAVTGTRPTGKPVPGEPAVCEAGTFLTKDPIDKVKAFYDKAVGPLKQAPQPYGQRSYGALLEVGERNEEGTPIAAIGIHALGPAIKAPSAPGKMREAYEKGALAWNAAWAPIHQLVYMVAWTPDMQDPFMYPYTPKEVDALAKKYNRSQSSFFVVDAASGKSRADALSDRFSEQAGQLRQQALTGNIAAQQAIAQSAGREGEKISAEEMQDDPEFNRIMQRKPALQKKYVALTQQTQQLMMSGKYDEAEAKMDEADKLLRSDPEMAALMKRYDAREQRRQEVSAKAEAQGQASQANAFGQASKKTWDLAVQTLDQLAKESYATYISIDCRLGGKVERDRAKLAAMDSGLHNEPADLNKQASQYKLTAMELGIKPEGDTPEQVAAAREAGKPQGAGATAKAAASTQDTKPGKEKDKKKQRKVAKQAPPQQKQGSGGSATDAAKQGLNVLKKLF